MTLIELMIVIAVIALLGGIAVPSYQAYVMKARRAEARGALTNAAQRLERFATENSTTGYSTATVSDTVGPTVVAARTSENGHYTLTLIHPAAPLDISSYTLEAARAGSQTADPCGTLTLNEKGERRVKAGTGTKTAAECW